LNPKALAVKRVKRVMNLDYLGTMGIMFLSQEALENHIWRRPSDRPPSNRATV
jgi:hypothetical protein